MYSTIFLNSRYDIKVKNKKETISVNVTAMGKQLKLTFKCFAPEI